MQLPRIWVLQGDGRESDQKHRDKRADENDINSTFYGGAAQDSGSREVTVTVYEA